jgi:hypothetical protein
LDTFIVGKPIPVERTGEPTGEQIEQLHAKYVDELVALFERHKAEYYPNINVKLRIL